MEHTGQGAIRAVVGESSSIARVRELVGTLAPGSLPVLVQGPTGAGKELVAQALHDAGGRRGGFVAVNVCAIAEAMFEDALFGHVRGAFTGAVADAPGYFAEADEGTIFLDEVSGLSLTLQAKLLRVLETGEFRPVGARANRQSRFRLVSATNECLATLAARGLFRADLLFRLRGAVITVPALRERPADVETLAQHFARVAARATGTPYRLSAAALVRLARHDWPGNVRELRHAVELACTLAPFGQVEVEHVATALDHGSWGIVGAADAQPRDDGAEALRALLVQHRWDIACVAAALGVTRKTVYERIRRFGLHFPQKYHRRRGDEPAGRTEPELALPAL